MPFSIWDKFTKIKDIQDNKENIKTYLSKLEVIIKEITPKNDEDLFILQNIIYDLKASNKLKIYDIIEENEKLYIVIDNNEKNISEFDALIASKEIEYFINKEGILLNREEPIEKSELLNLFKMESAMCKIHFEKIEKKEITKGKGTGFFCEVDYKNLPIKYGLFTNNHILNESAIEVGKDIFFENKGKLYNIKITPDRRVFTNPKLDYTCIEILKSDNINNYFKIDSNIYSNNKDFLIKNDIFILQYPKGNDFSFSSGTILNIKNETIYHNCSTNEGSSGSPIIRRSYDNYVLGIHYGECKNKNNKNSCNFNLGNTFDYILKDMVQSLYNNIIYYNDNTNDLDEIYNESNYFERNTNGAFILCNDIESLKYVGNEIVNEFKVDNKIKFNLILGETNFEIFESFLNENKEFNNRIENLCLYCKEPKKYEHLKNNFKNLNAICENKEEIINYIAKFASNKLRPFSMIKLITYQDYKNLELYRNMHYKISKFYGDLTLESYNNYFETIRTIIKGKTESQLNKKVEALSGFLVFKIDNDLESIDKLIIKEWTKNTIHYELNKWLLKPEMDNFNPKAYFISRFMYSLNNYAKKNNMFCFQDNKILYRGVKMSYNCLLSYKRAKGKIIVFPYFTSTSEIEKIAQKWSISKRDLKFSIIFKIQITYNNNSHYNNSSAIDISNVSQYIGEKEYLIQPFTFFLLEDVQIDFKNRKAIIHLKTIEKTEILEIQIKKGKEIVYDEKENIIKVKE